MGVNDVAGHPGNWPAKAKPDHRTPVCVTGIMLRGDGRDIVVEAEIDGEWREVIREFAPYSDETVAISHIVEPSGMRKAPPSRLGREEGT